MHHVPLANETYSEKNGGNYIIIFASFNELYLLLVSINYLQLLKVSFHKIINDMFIKYFVDSLCMES